MKHVPVLVLAVLLSVSSVSAAVYAIDPVHSSVLFSVRHLVGRVTGRFNKFDGTFDYDPAHPESLKTSATIDQHGK